GGALGGGALGGAGVGCPPVYVRVRCARGACHSAAQGSSVCPRGQKFSVSTLAMAGLVLGRAVCPRGQTEAGNRGHGPDRIITNSLFKPIVVALIERAPVIFRAGPVLVAGFVTCRAAGRPRAG